MWSNLRVFRRDGGFAWIERRSLRDAQLTELKKYAVFSKVTIAANDDLVLLGVAGFQARAALAPLFAACPTPPPRWSAKAPPACCGLNIRASASCW
jgi:folate-binding Fe-S cluster repair protein YgfZ